MLRINLSVFQHWTHFATINKEPYTVINELQKYKRLHWKNEKFKYIIFYITAIIYYNFFTSLIHLYLKFYMHLLKHDREAKCSQWQTNSSFTKWLDDKLFLSYKQGHKMSFCSTLVLQKMVHIDTPASFQHFPLKTFLAWIQNGPDPTYFPYDS